MEHIFENVCDELEYKANPIAFNRKLLEPRFIGQGCSERAGSDCYGYFIVQKKEIGKNVIWGIAPAKTHFTISWADGGKTCDGPSSWQAQYWIIKWRNKWWMCDENGVRHNKQKCCMSFKGARAYQDPSF